jgi:hypothetical protein
VAQRISLVCRVCGCTDEKPCQITTKTGQRIACEWFDNDCTLCSNFRCIAQTPLADLERMMQDAINAIEAARLQDEAAARLHDGH